MRLLPACLVLVGLMAAPHAARAQIESREGIALQNQILELRAQIDALRKSPPPASGGYSTTVAPPPSSSGGGGIDAQLLDRVQRLEDTVRELRGRIDDADNTRQRQYDDLNKKIDDLAFKLGNGGLPATAPAGNHADATNPPPPTAPPTPTTPTAPGTHRTAEVVLQDGNAALARRDYATAQADAREVLAAGKGPRQGDAQFLLAQALAGGKDYSAAAVAYDDSYNHARTGTHAQDSLLGLANALVAINEKKAACETLDKLHAEFPTRRADLKEPIATSRKNAGCK